jgi:hypothetical protein
MRLVDSNTLNGLSDWPFMSPLELLSWVPENTVVKESVFVLNLVSCPSRIPVHRGSVFSFDLDLVFGVMLYPWGAIRICLDTSCEASKLILLAPEFSSIPVVEVSEK